LFDDFAHQKFATPLSLGDAEQILLQTEIFAFNGPSHQVQAWNVVFDQHDAVARFQSLVSKARVAGQLYAFCALSSLEPVDAENAVTRISALKGNVRVAESDMAYYRTSAALLDLIRSRRLWERFRADKDKTNQWFIELANRARGPNLNP
jgi:hypothetical protein